MSSKIVIVDYGMGNLHSVNKAIAFVGGDPFQFINVLISVPMRILLMMPQLLHRLIN